MSKLFPENQPAVTAEFIEALLKPYQLDLVDYQLAKSGIENTTIMVATANNKVVIRIYRQFKKSTQGIATELAFMEFLRAHSVPTPEIIRNASGEKISQVTADGKKWQAILMEYVEGRHDVGFDGKVIGQLARLQAKMHLLGQQFKADRPEQSLRTLQETIFYKHIDRKAIKSAKVLAFLDRAKHYRIDLARNLPEGWSHFDFDPDNVLFDNQRSVRAILDFDDLAYMPLVICLGYTLWDLFVEHEDIGRLKEYLKVYESERRLSVAERAVLPGIMLFRHYVISSSDIAFGRNGAATEDEMLERERLIKQLVF